MTSQPLIAVVGPCKSGKSTLILGLEEKGFHARQIAQEHSFAPRMWQQIGKADILIYLHCDFDSTLQRGINWTRAEYEAQQPRLAHARKHADLEIATDTASPADVLTETVEFLESQVKDKR